TGTKEQIKKEFSEWLRDNWNHPSIIIWDALNESSDDEVQNDIIPEMKKLDPTRPWEPVDLLEEHPYIYSLGPVLNDRKFGFTRSLDAIKHSAVPTMLNEFVWWWLNSEVQPTVLMNGVAERWLGPSYTGEDLLNHQAFLAQELVELFRRMRVDAIQPFVHLSNNDGPTSHWFLGPIADLKPKPILAALKNAYSPFGVSIELWDRHFHSRERRTVTIVIFNDEYVDQEGLLEFGIQDASKGWTSKDSKSIVVTASGALRLPVELPFPEKEGTYCVRAELKRRDGSLVAWSQKIAHILQESHISPNMDKSAITVLEPANEIKSFLQSKGVQAENFSTDSLHHFQVLVIAHGEIRAPRYQQRIDTITQFVRSGGSLVIVEPEFGVKGKDKIKVLRDLELTIEYREDADRGGYDSYIFAVNPTHALWNNLTPDHFKMFNGAFGGEIVSQHNVTPSVEPMVHARCGLELNTRAVMETPYGSGRVLISRLQLRNRLFIPEAGGSLFGRRIDPVLQRYLLNLLSYACN
ncbi:MAG: hypothetical protein HY089_06855, partial [Ignavibacteriales bacterium]|nr:hypothetical protein [Ignavibacteriales bacterium]